MHIKLARPKDIPALMQLYHYLSTNYQDNPDAIDSAIKHPATFVFVAVLNYVVVGTATLSVRAVPCKGFIGYIDDVVVDPGYLRQGIAECLIGHLIESARNLDCVQVSLTSNASRVAANRLYEKLGFGHYKTKVYAIQL